MTVFIRIFKPNQRARVSVSFPAYINRTQALGLLYHTLDFTVFASKTSEYRICSVPLANLNALRASAYLNQALRKRLQEIHANEGEHFDLVLRSLLPKTLLKTILAAVYNEPLPEGYIVVRSGEHTYIEIEDLEIDIH